MLNKDRKINFHLIIVSHQLCSNVYAKFPDEGIGHGPNPEKGLFFVFVATF